MNECKQTVVVATARSVCTSVLWIWWLRGEILVSCWFFWWYRMYQKGSATPQENIHSFHWHVQNATIPCCSQELLPFLPVMYFFLPPFSTNYSSIVSHFILPSISWVYLSILFPNSYIIPFWELYFLPFSVHAQTNVIYLTLLSL